MSLTAIVPVWNQRALLERLLTSLEEQTAPAAELIVVDNGSEDGAPGAARDRGARVLPMGRNAGFAAAVNRGIQECRTDWIAVLNSDVRLAPDYFVRLLEAAQRTGAWFVSGKILVEDGSCIDGTFDGVAPPGGLAAAGATARCSPKADLSGPRPGRRPYSAPSCSSGLACWTKVSNRTWRTLTSACAAQRSNSQAATYQTQWPGIAEAPRSEDGIRKPCGTSRATSSFCWRGTIPRRRCFVGRGRSRWPRFYGEAWRYGTAPGSVGCGVLVRAFGIIPRRDAPASRYLQDS
jgi:hypothetical protein